MHGFGTFWSSLTSSLPWPTAVAGAMVAIGLVLWLGGHRVIRGMLVLLGCMLGACAGVLAFRYVSAGGLASTVGTGGSSPLIALAIGVVLGGVLGYVSHRPLIVGLCSLLVGAASVGIAVIAFHITIPTESLNPVGHESASIQPVTHAVTLPQVASEHDESLDTETLAALARLAGDSTMASSESNSAMAGDSKSHARPLAGALLPDATAAPLVPEPLRAISEPVGAFARESATRLHGVWNELPVRARGVLTIAVAVGLACGCLLGVLSPRYAAGLTTASIGAAAWLAGVGTLATMMLPDAAGMLEQPAWMWLSGWGATALVGTAWQWRLIAKHAASPKPKTA